MVSLRKMALVMVLVAAGSMVFGQGTTPPPTKSSEFIKRAYEIEVDFGRGSFGGDLDWDVLLAVTFGWSYDVMDNLGVGVHINRSAYDSTHDSDIGEDFKVLTLDAFGAYTFDKDLNGMWGLAGFLALGGGKIDAGSVDDMGLNYGFGIVFDYKLADQWKLAPYVKWGQTNSAIDFDALTFGVNVLLTSKRPVANVVLGVAWEKQGVEIERGSQGLVSTDGSGFVVTLGIEGYFK